MTSSFEWDPAKEAENLRKHGVSFREAQLAFLDPERVIARDVAHALSAQGIGAKDRRSMKRKGNYTDEPMGQLEVVEDILPSPNRLVLKEDGVKITISLSKHSVDFFKAHALRDAVAEMPQPRCPPTRTAQSQEPGGGPGACRALGTGVVG